MPQLPSATIIQRQMSTSSAVSSTSISHRRSVAIAIYIIWKIFMPIQLNCARLTQSRKALRWFFNSFNHNRTTRHFSEIFFSFALIIGTLLSAAIVSRRHMCRSVYLCTKQCIHDTRAAGKCVFRIFNFVSLLLESLRSNGNADDSPQ